MNQDFGLALTPANGRRLLRITQNFNIRLDPDIIAAASDNLLTDDAFDPLICAVNPERLAVTQFLLDCNLRGVVQQNYHPSFNETALLNAVRLGNPATITIIATKHPGHWRKVAGWLGLAGITEVHDGSLTGETIDARRCGVLIYDMGDRLQQSVHNYACEFAHTIIFEQQHDFTTLTPWPVLANILWPTMPSPLYAKACSRIPSDWCKISLYQFAPFYNVAILPELINSSAIVDMLSDNILRRRIQEYI